MSLLNDITSVTPLCLLKNIYKLLPNISCHIRKVQLFRNADKSQNPWDWYMFCRLIIINGTAFNTNWY